MMGKILGVALVGLSQIAIWFFLFSLISMVANGILFSSGDIDPATVQEMLQNQSGSIAQPASKAQEIMLLLNNMNFPLILFSFVFYFFGGYLLYSSLMGAIGAAVDSEEDTQQFILPVTAPLIISIIVLVNGIQNPEGPLAFWFSIIPLTSPVMMMVRIPFDPPAWQIVLSMFLLAVSFMGTVWMAAKIYRTGILLYGKKISYKELLEMVTIQKLELKERIPLITDPLKLQKAHFSYLKMFCDLQFELIIIILRSISSMLH